jgi:hypothetical protein
MIGLVRCSTSFKSNYSLLIGNYYRDNVSADSNLTLVDLFKMGPSVSSKAKNYSISEEVILPVQFFS